MRMLVVIPLLALLWPGVAAASQCTKACSLTRRGCITQAKADRKAMRADCKELDGGSRTCIHAAVTHVRASLATCRSSTTQCRACCSDGGTPAKCSTGCDGTPMKSTWAGIQRLFDDHGCTQAACHGAAKQGGLDLSRNVAYKDLVEAHATAVDLARVQPGDERRSFLFMKLAAATNPSLLDGSVPVGTPMPNGGLPPLSGDELEAIRKWIYAGAPETGTVTGTDTLLAACLPPARPIRIRPLAAPRPDAGFQLTLPTFKLEAHSEHEYCFATYYDVTKKVPKEFQDPSGKLFLFGSQELRQDPQSHHLIISRYGGTAGVTDPSFGRWQCAGGKKNGTSCDPLCVDGEKDGAKCDDCGKDSSCVAFGPPHCDAGPKKNRDCSLTDPSTCPQGTCVEGPRQTFACIGFGPTKRGGFIPQAIGGAQKAQAFSQFPAGVYGALPMQGIIYWNPHAFNLSDRDTVLHGWINYNFTSDTKYPVQNIFDVSKIFAPDAAPFTKQTICNDHVLPKGTRLYALSSHTHRHGEDFTIQGPDGTLLYENFVYNDPPTKEFDPPLAFDSDVDAERTLHYCSLFNNGLTAEGGFDTELVTRASRVPPDAPAFSRCTPEACVAGKVGAACATNADCDSTPGAGDGNCDACSIHGGESTENEMFILMGQYYLP